MFESGTWKKKMKKAPPNTVTMYMELRIGKERFRANAYVCFVAPLVNNIVSISH